MKVYGRRKYVEEKVKGTLKEKVQDALDVIRPQMQADGGDIELIDVAERHGQGASRGRMLRLPRRADDASNGCRTRAQIESARSQNSRGDLANIY